MHALFLTWKLLILLSFYIHNVLEQVKTHVFANLHFERVLHFVIDYARILLHNTTDTLWPRETSCRLTYFRGFCNLNSPCTVNSCLLDTPKI